MKNLVELYLGPNRFDAAPFPAFEELPNLQHLYVNGCSLRGPIPSGTLSLKALGMLNRDATCHNRVLRYLTKLHLFFRTIRGS